MTDKMVILSLLNLGNYVGTEPIELTKLEDAKVERERETKCHKLQSQTCKNLLTLLLAVIILSHLVATWKFMNEEIDLPEERV
jgi:hypothetical protein